MTVEYDLGAPEPVAPLDPAVVQRVRRRRLRGLALLLAGAVAGLVLIAVPAVALSAARPAAGAGLPDRWYRAPAGTPLARDWRMPAASMLLATGGHDRIVVSVGGSRYARLGLTARDSYPALSDDGALVAWLSTGPRGDGVLHVLRLADGRSLTVPVHRPGFRPVALLWNQGSVEVTAWAGAPAGGEVRPGTPQLTCSLVSVISRPDRFATNGPLAQEFCDDQDAQAVGPPAPALDADPYSMVWQAESGSSASLRRGTGGVPTLWIIWVARTDLPAARIHPLEAGGPGRSVRSARLLAWSAAGIVVAVETTDGHTTSREVRLVSPENATERVVSRAAPGVAGMPTGVAPGALGADAVVAANPPSYPFWRPASIASLTRRVQADHRGLEFLALAVPVLLLGAGAALLGGPPGEPKS